MKQVLFFLAALVLGMSACRKADNDRCLNLASKSSFKEAADLYGNWQVMYLARTNDGLVLKDKQELSGGMLRFLDEENARLSYDNQIWFSYKVTSPNSLGMKQTGSTFVGPRPEEDLIVRALWDAQCFRLKDNELWIHFYNHNQIKEKNILVLKKI